MTYFIIYIYVSWVTLLPVSCFGDSLTFGLTMRCRAPAPRRPSPDILLKKCWLHQHSYSNISFAPCNPNFVPKYLSQLVSLILFQTKQLAQPHFRANLLLHNLQNTKQSPKERPLSGLKEKTQSVFRGKSVFQEASVFQGSQKTAWQTYLPHCFTVVSMLYNHFSCRSVSVGTCLDVTGGTAVTATIS